MKAVASGSPDGNWNALIAEWLAGLFMAPPSTNAIVSYRDGQGATFLDICMNEPGCGDGARQMRTALAREDSPRSVTRKLGIAFTLLFDGVGGQRTVSLYESAHVSTAGRLFQTPVRDMEMLLRRADLATSSATREPPDHLSVELALLARLMRRGAVTEDQVALLDNHLLAWTPCFADRCREYDSTGFYAGAAKILTGFLLAWRAALGGDLVPTRMPLSQMNGSLRC